MRNTWLIFFLAIISFLSGTDEYIVTGILDKIAETNGVSIASAGQLFTVFSISFGLLTPIVIVLTRKMDRKNLLMIALLIFSLSNFIVATFEGFVVIFIARIASGVSAGLIEVTLLTIATTIAEPEKRGSAIATIITGFSAALIVGVPMGRFLASVMDWRFIFVALSVLGTLFLILIYKLIPGMQGEEEKPLKEQLKILKNKKIAYILIVTFFWMFSYSIVLSYISPYLLQVVKVSSNTVSIALLIYGLSSLVGSKLGGFSTDKYGAIKTIFLGMSINAFGLISFSFVGESSLIFLIPLIIWGIAAWSSGPALQFRLIYLAPSVAGIILSLYTSISQIGMAFGAGIGGLIVNFGSLDLLNWVGASSVILIIFSLLIVNQKQKVESQNK
ncbi:MFS transporter [Priestia megaterium]|uniref:MFS transporter n=1 Tax=Priestia megaterium TaxID=1404 RepID=UPI0025A4BD3D|nr:MFS transporter [Priestia megaterium]MDM8150048.1 MFS transporter [Priestia megaterium]